MRKSHTSFTPALTATLAAAVYAIAILSLHRWDPMVFVLLGTRFTTGDPLGSEGYDGQFVYQIALRPTEAAEYLDTPAYRYQRILYPLLAHGLAAAQPALVPWALLLINLASAGVSARMAARLLERGQTSPWFALIIGLFAGQLLALRTDLPEPLALGGMATMEHAQRISAMTSATEHNPSIHWPGLAVSAILFASSALTKETMLLTAAGYGLYL
ncbi:MAG: hypothetical protein JSV36_21265 [Anaerolineae bacterium]|nr:MAG: hypothetical protein JSV36_21265 [Anaerolineae bacterium]